jgi:transcriptional regulator with XRE-family HTH domain
MTVSEQIRVAFMASGYTVTYVAMKSGVSESTIRNILHTRRNVGVDNVIAVAGVLGVRMIEVPSARASYPVCRQCSPVLRCDIDCDWKVKLRAGPGTG